MGHVILILRIFNKPFLFILYNLQVIKIIKVFLSNSQHSDIIASGVILNPIISHECIALTKCQQKSHVLACLKFNEKSCLITNIIYCRLISF